jgi:hypothetical protein
MHRIPDRSEVQRNGPTFTEWPYASRNWSVGPLPTQRTPLQTLKAPEAVIDTLRSGEDVWQ